MSDIPEIPPPAKGGSLKAEFEKAGDLELLGNKPDEGVLPLLEKNHGEFRMHDVVGKTRKRRVIVYLPPGYSDQDPFRYPVVYVHDGQNIFDPSTAAFGVEWGLDAALLAGIRKATVRPMILVAIYNSRQRLEEYTPTCDPTHRGGKADAYLDFVVEDVKSFIDENYNTQTGADNTGVLGSSLGGLLALYSGWRRHDVFGVVGALSPSLWWAGRDLITGICGDPNFKGPRRLWIDMGTRESNEDRNKNGVPDVLDDLRTLRAVLLFRGYKEGDTLFYEEVQGAAHTETDWGKRAGKVLATLFPPELV